MDHKIELFFNDQGEFIQRIDGRELKLHPYVGVQLQAHQEQGRDWTRKEIMKYESVDVMKYLKSKEAPNAAHQL